MNAMSAASEVIQLTCAVVVNDDHQSIAACCLDLKFATHTGKKCLADRHDRRPSAFSGLTKTSYADVALVSLGSNNFAMALPLLFTLV